MLDINNAIRVEKRLKTCKNKRPWYETIWIFKCLDCPKEMPKTKHGIKTHTGKCVKCVKRSAHPYQTIYNCMKSSVERTNKKYSRECPFKLSFEEFLEYTQVASCFYCGERNITWNEYSSGPYNLDRKDNSVGYQAGNLAVCCYECNYRKNRFYNHEEFLLISEVLKLYRISDEHGKAELLLSLTTTRFDIEHGRNPI